MVGHSRLFWAGLRTVTPSVRSNASKNPISKLCAPGNGFCTPARANLANRT